MEYKGKKLKNLVVTLPYADGTNVDCGVVASFELSGNTYMALQPLNKDGTFDLYQNMMLYRVEEDGEGNPIVIYIEDDAEYESAAKYFSESILQS